VCSWRNTIWIIRCDGTYKNLPSSYIGAQVNAEFGTANSPECMFADMSHISNALNHFGSLENFAFCLFYSCI
jgi:hypothetical protein